MNTNDDKIDSISMQYGTRSRDILETVQQSARGVPFQTQWLSTSWGPTGFLSLDNCVNSTGMTLRTSYVKESNTTIMYWDG